MAQVISPCKILLVSDSNVAPLYADRAEASLKKAGYAVSRFVFPAGEASKTIDTYIQLLEACACAELSRSDALVALGGGVTGDMTGFAAATYLRGIRFVQIPTSFLAAIDSSVGGKTAVDLKAKKNHVGAFWQPSLVLCDPDVFQTLSDAIFADGVAEAVKYSMIADADLLTLLEQHRIEEDIEQVVTRCVEIKRDVVTEDEFETGGRRILNFGHTLGHAVESCSQFGISHGKAVSIGMAIVCRSACKHGWLDQSVCQRILNCLEQFGLPVNTEYSSEVLFHAALSDKKRSGSSVNMILPRSIGDCTIVPVPNSELKAFIESGLSV